MYSTVSLIGEPQLFKMGHSSKLKTVIEIQPGVIAVDFNDL